LAAIASHVIQEIDNPETQ